MRRFRLFENMNSRKSYDPLTMPPLSKRFNRFGIIVVLWLVFGLVSWFVPFLRSDVWQSYQLWVALFFAVTPVGLALITSPLWRGEEDPYEEGYWYRIPLIILLFGINYFVFSSSIPAMLTYVIPNSPYGITVEVVDKDRNIRMRSGCEYEVSVAEKDGGRRFKLCVGSDGYSVLKKGDTIAVFGRESWFGRTITEWGQVFDSGNVDTRRSLRHVQYIFFFLTVMAVGAAYAHIRAKSAEKSPQSIE